jgi:hypothetical protein
MVSITRNSFAEDDGLSVTVTSTAAVSHFWKRSNPAKLFKCWGGPDNAEAYNDAPKTAVSQGPNSGTLSSTFRGDKTGYEPFNPQTVSWNDSLSENRDLTLEFSQNLDPTHRSYLHHFCATERFDSKLDGVSNTMSTKVLLTIPAGVRILRIREHKPESTFKSMTQLKTTITKAASMVTDDLDNSADPYSERGRDIRFEIGEYTYFFVRPSDQIRFEVTYTSEELRSGNMKAAFDIRLIGYDGCNRFADPAHPGAIDSQLLTFSAAKSNPHEFIERIGCLRSPEYLTGLLYNNQGYTLMKELSALSDTASQIDSAAKLPFHDQLSIATVMTTFDIAHSLLNDLSLYCDPALIREQFGLAPKEGVKIRGYYYVARAYARVQFLLNMVPTHLMQTFADTIQGYASKSVSYKDAIRSGKDVQVLNELAGAINDSDFEVYDEISLALEVVPKIKLGNSTREQLGKDLKLSQAAAIQLRNEIQATIASLQARSTQLVSSDSLNAALTNFNRLNKAVHDDLRNDIAWFLDGSDNSIVKSEFFKNMQALNNDILAQAIGVLQNYTTRLSAQNQMADFLRVETTRNLIDRTNRCLLRSAE